MDKMTKAEPELILKMHEDYCCGGGHCGPLPGYDFICPRCRLESYCHTGDSLLKGQFFECSQCDARFEVLECLKDTHFKIRAFVRSEEVR